ncbi:MAG: right-handed parallel beta-helix repeat-containing protein [Candidatus Hermodarchaeota archaeon]
MKTKTKSSILLSILLLGTAIGFLALTVGIVYANETITVSPSGGDDTANLQAAFDAAIAAGPGSTVQLTEGQFYSNEVFIYNFYGTFKGMGKDTVIDVLRGFDPGAPGVAGLGGEPPHIFNFIGGDVYITDMSFDITPFETAEPWDVGFTDLLSPILIAGEINSRVENVKVTGHDGTAGYPDWHPLFGVKAYNVRAGVILGSALSSCIGTHTITNCEFDSLWLGISAYMWMSSEIKIKHNTIKGGAIGIINADNINSNFEISHNYIEANAYAGIWVMQFAPFACQWLIRHNTIKPTILADGISLQDFTAGSLKGVVSHNKIELDTFWGGIWTSDVSNAFISNNIVRGTGDYGIVCAFANNNMLLGNNVQNVDASWASIVLLYSSECVVVGGSTKKNVLDIAGFNNIIVGMNNMQSNSPGPEIQEAMELKRELIRCF